MTRRRVLLLGLVAVVVALAGGVWLLWPRPTAITLENAERIKEGITLAEVETILGGPARDETGGAGEPLYERRTAIFFGHEHEWIGPEYAVSVLPVDDRVFAVRVGVVIFPAQEPPLLQRVRRWLHL